LGNARWVTPVRQRPLSDTCQVIPTGETKYIRCTQRAAFTPFLPQVKNREQLGAEIASFIGWFSVYMTIERGKNIEADSAQKSAA